MSRRKGKVGKGPLEKRRAKEEEKTEETELMYKSQKGSFIIE